LSDLDARLLAGFQPAAPDRAGDLSMVTTGRVLDVDPASSTVRVSVHQSDGSWVRATPARYVIGSVCTVILNPLQGGRAVLVLPSVAPSAPSVLSTLVATDDTTQRATVLWAGEQVTVPFIPSTYTVGDEVWVDTDAWGRPFRVSAPSDDPPPPPKPVTTPAVVTGASAVATTVLFPQWSGTYRHASTWDRWNVNRYGGRSTLYQGNGYGSGALTGLATYGDQIVNLGAVNIDRARVMLRGVGLSGAAGPATVQGSPHGSRPDGPPTGAGATATGDGWVDLPASMLDAMETGAVKGLALVGPNYWAVAGAGNGDGMALEVTYRRPV
jgi:hypothetical protein